MSRKTAAAALLAAATLASPNAAQARGSGTGKSADTAPITKSSGPSAQRPQLPSRAEPTASEHGFMGGPGAAPDGAGPSRLGLTQSRTPPGAARDATADAGAQAYEPWKSGDMVRSRSSADVRSARRADDQDLEWVSTAGAGEPAPYGKDFQKGQEKTKR